MRIPVEKLDRISGKICEDVEEIYEEVPRTYDVNFGKV